MRLAILDGISGLAVDFSVSDPIYPGLNSANTSLDGTSQIMIGAIMAAAAADPPIFTANLPNWGRCELMYVRYIGAAAILPGRLVHLDKDFTISDVPTGSSNSGRPVGVALTSFSAGNVIPQGGWVMLSGIAPVQYAVAATAGQVFASGASAGQATPTAAAGRQLLNANCLIAAAGNFTRNVKTTNGSPFVDMLAAGSSGIFIGQAVSGTGIPGGATVSSITSDGRTIKMSANATASGVVTGTFTHTNFGIVEFSRPFVQGQIT